MFVKEFGSVSANELNQQLNKVYRWQLSLNTITENDASQMLQTISSKIKKIKSTSQAHHAERNPQYMEAVMVGKILETWKNEMATKRTRLSEAMRRIDRYCAVNLNERELTPTELKKRDHYKGALEKREGEFTKRYGPRGDEVMYATATKMAKNESYILPPALTEGEIEQARVTMAARDLADSVQDIVEKISDMQNEKLPALVSAMKDQIGMEQANQFSEATKTTLATLLDAANSARDALDNASRSVGGGQPMDMGGGDDMDMGNDMGGGEETAPDMNAPLGGDEAITPPRDNASELDAADAAAGGVGAEMGRGRRA